MHVCIHIYTHTWIYMYIWYKLPLLALFFFAMSSDIKAKITKSIETCFIIWCSLTID